MVVRERWYVGLVVGVACAALGWTLGGLVGSLMWRSLAAVAAIAILHGCLLGGARGAFVVGVAGTVAASMAYVAGAHLASPLIAWPVLGATLGLATGRDLSGFGRRLIALGLGAALISALFVIGLVLVVVLGFGLNDGAVFSQLFLGGAVGAGMVPPLLLVLRRRLGRVRAEVVS